MKIQGFEVNFSNNNSSDKVLQWVTNDRTAGSIPSWVTAKTAKENLEQKLSTPASHQEFSQVLAYQEERPIQEKNTSFGFKDLVDMVNPLQHIPILNIAYREITGDEIKPIGKIVGGAVFCGPMGVAGGIIDAIVTQETGKDMAGNALSFVEKGTNQEDFAIKARSVAQAYERVQFVEARTAGTMVRYG